MAVERRRHQRQANRISDVAWYVVICPGVSNCIVTPKRDGGMPAYNDHLVVTDNKRTRRNGP